MKTYFGLTSVEAGLHKHSYSSDTQLEIVGRDMSSITDNERQRLHALDERLGVVLAKILTQSQTILVDQRVVQLSFRAEWRRLTDLEIVFSDLEH